LPYNSNQFEEKETAAQEKIKDCVDECDPKTILLMTIHVHHQWQRNTVGGKGQCIGSA
jgi:hypothetical protein